MIESDEDIEEENNAEEEDGGRNLDDNVFGGNLFLIDRTEICLLLRRMIYSCFLRSQLG